MKSRKTKSRKPTKRKRPAPPAMRKRDRLIGIVVRDGSDFALHPHREAPAWDVFQVQSALKAEDKYSFGVLLAVLPNLDEELAKAIQAQRDLYVAKSDLIFLALSRYLRETETRGNAKRRSDQSG